MNSQPRPSVVRSSNRGVAPVELPAAKSVRLTNAALSAVAQAAATAETPKPVPKPEPPEPVDTGLPARWLQQVVLLASLSVAVLVGAMTLNAGCAFLTAVFRASVAMICVAGLGVALAHVMMTQIAQGEIQGEKALPAAGDETRRTT